MMFLTSPNQYHSIDNYTKKTTHWKKRCKTCDQNSNYAAVTMNSLLKDRHFLNNHFISPSLHFISKQSTVLRISRPIEFTPRRNTLPTTIPHFFVSSSLIMHANANRLRRHLTPAVVMATAVS